MSIVLDGTSGITTPDLESAGPISGTTGTFSGAVSATTGSFSGDVTLGSSVLATPSGSAPSYTCRAWVNFNGTSTVAIRASGNVSSITDAGTGTYNVNFATAMPDANYAISGCMDNSSGSNAYIIKNGSVANTASVAYIYSAVPGAAVDSVFCTVSFFR